MDKKELIEKISQLIEEYDGCLEEKKPSLQLEDHNFRVNSDGWMKTTIDGERYLVNEEEDIWEFLDGECAGEQLFTWKAMMRETEEAGKRVPTDEELSILMETKEDMPNLMYSGYRSPSGAFSGLGSSAYFWSSSQSSSTDAWRRYLLSSESRVSRATTTTTFGFSVRCLKD